MKEITEQEAFLRLSAQCAQAEHCQFEMLEKMRRWGVTEEAQARVMARLVGGRFVDEERYARAFVKDKVKYNKWGRRKVEQALWQKRIDADIRQRVLDEIDTDEYVEVLRPLLQQKRKSTMLQQKRKSTKANSPYELQQKLIRFALGRGFDFDVIRECLDVDDADTEM